MATATKDVLLPDIGDFDSVDVIEVLVAPGDRVKREDSLVTLESEKATMEVPSPEAGVVREISVKVGDKISQGSLLLQLEPEEEGASEADSGSSAESSSGTAAESTADTAADKASTEDEASTAESATDTSVEASEEKPTEEQKPASEAPAVNETDFARAHAGPSVRRFARELGVDLGQVQGSGRKGRILRDDVQAWVKGRLAKGTAGGTGLPPMPEVDFSRFGPVESRALSKIRRVSAANLHRNWVNVPHVTQFDEVDITGLEAFRKEQAAAAREQGVRLSLPAFLLKAVAAALKAFPEVNSSLHPNGEALILKGYVHIGVAVDTPEGLVVPVIRDVDQKGVLELARELGELSARARDRKLRPEEMQGGCFSISSLGGIGGTAFTPIVNAPEVAILGVSRAVTRPVWQDSEFVPRLMLPLSLSYDHRVIDGANAARFIVYLGGLLADMRRVLL